MCMLAEVGKCSNVGMLTRKIPPNIICDCFDLDIKGETHNISLCREHYALAYLYYDKACAFCNIRCKRYGIKYKAFVPEEINDEIIQEYMVSNNIKCFPSEANSILCTGCHSKLFYFVKSQAQTKDIFLMNIVTDFKVNDKALTSAADIETAALNNTKSFVANIFMNNNVVLLSEVYDYFLNECSRLSLRCNIDVLCPLSVHKLILTFQATFGGDLECYAQPDQIGCQALLIWHGIDLKQFLLKIMLKDYFKIKSEEREHTNSTEQCKTREADTQTDKESVDSHVETVTANFEGISLDDHL